MKTLKIALPILLLVVLLLSPMFPARALADGGTIVGIDITSPWSITCYLDLNSPSITLYIDGVSLQDLISSAVSAAKAGNAPNSQWSGRKDLSFLGYFGIDSNIKEYTLIHWKMDPGTGQPMIDPVSGKQIALETITLSVYMGAGCGNWWGIADAYPDLFSRRQIIGIVFAIKSLQWNLADLFDRGATLEKKVATLEASDNLTQATLKSQGADIQNLQKDVATLNSYKKRVENLEAQNRIMAIEIYVIGAVAVVSVLLAVALLVAYLRRRKW